MKPGLRSLGIRITAQENPGKPQLGNRLMNAVLSHRHKRCSLLPNSVGRVAQYILKTDLKVNQRNL